MKIRTITYFVSGFPDEAELQKGGRFLKEAKAACTRAGYEVQTLRMALGSVEAVLVDPRAGSLAALCERLEGTRNSLGVDFFNLGRVRDPGVMGNLGEHLIRFPRLSASADGAGFLSGRHEGTLKAAASLTLRLSRETPQGLGNFSFCVSFCMGGGTPFFPSGFAAPGPSAFALGLENSDLLVKAFQGVTEASGGLAAFKAAYQAVVSKLEALMLEIERDTAVPWLGLDTSLAPSLDPAESLALPFERMGMPLGAPGSLGLCAEITGILKGLTGRKTGYCGLMLPVMEDVGLCALADQGKLTLPVLLMMSSVCGVGLDTVPIPGSASDIDVMKLYADTAGLALKWNKPLSVRVFPVAGRGAGERTAFDFPHLTNCRIFPVS